MMTATEETVPQSPPLRPGPSGLSRERVTEIQRARILAAAIEVVEELGYAGMTVAQVLARAKVSRKTFYDIFADRQACFLGVFDQGIDQIRAVVEADAADRSREWREMVRSGLARLLIFLDEEPALARICLVEAQGSGAKLLERRVEILMELAGVVDLGRSAPGAVREPPDITAEAVIGACFTVLQMRLLERGGRPLEELLGPLMSIILLPYLGARAASSELYRPTGPSKPVRGSVVRGSKPARGFNAAGDAERAGGSTAAGDAKPARGSAAAEGSKPARGSKQVRRPNSARESQ